MAQGKHTAAADIKLKDGKLHYVFQGRGSPLVLLHSLGTSCDAWRKVMPDLARDHSVYALDMMGHADSAKPRRQYEMDDFGQNVVDFMNGLKIKKASVIGNSVGASLACQIAAAHPDMVDRLVLVGLPGWESDQEKQEARKFAILQYDDKCNPLPRSLEDLKAHYVNVSPELQQWVNSLRAKAGPWAWKTMEALYRFDAVAAWGKIACPTLLVYGEKDLLAAKGNAVKSRIRGARLAIIPKAGHLPQLDNPEEFVRVVRGFLAAP